MIEYSLTSSIYCHRYRFCFTIVIIIDFINLYTIAATIRELNLQINLRKEIETAMKLMERDLHEKQDTLIVLRQQLTDVKVST